MVLSLAVVNLIAARRMSIEFDLAFGPIIRVKFATRPLYPRHFTMRWLVQAGKLDGVRKMLSSGQAYPNYTKYDDGWTLLHVSSLSVQSDSQSSLILDGD
jgi:hypothetical protein